MKHVRLIRHGESAANAGQATLDHATIPLTLKGFEQAQLVALSFNHAPTLIVASPFTRAHSTAMATAAVFPNIPLKPGPSTNLLTLNLGGVPIRPLLRDETGSRHIGPRQIPSSRTVKAQSHS